MKKENPSATTAEQSSPKYPHELTLLASKLAHNSIVTQALTRLLLQIMTEVYQSHILPLEQENQRLRTLLEKKK